METVDSTGFKCWILTVYELMWRNACSKDVFVQFNVALKSLCGFLQKKKRKETILVNINAVYILL